MFNSLIVSFNLYHDVDRLLCVLVNVCFGGRNLHYMCTCISLNRTVMYCWATDERAQFHQTRFDSYTDFVNIRANVGLPIELHYNIQRELCFVLIVYRFRLHAVLPVCGRSSDYILNSTMQLYCTIKTIGQSPIIHSIAGWPNARVQKANTRNSHTERPYFVANMQPLITSLTVHKHRIRSQWYSPGTGSTYDSQTCTWATAWQAHIRSQFTKSTRTSRVQCRSHTEYTQTHTFEHVLRSNRPGAHV